MELIAKYRFLSLLICLFGTIIAHSQEPDPPIITSVSIDPQSGAPGAVSIYWLPSTDPLVTGYILYKKINDETHAEGFFPISQDFQQSDYSYTDTEVDARNSSVSYKIASLPNGLPGNEHQTLFLHPVLFDSCAMTNTLTWNHYQGWEGGAYYTVLNENGDVIKDFVEDSVWTHQIQPNTTYTYQILAIKNVNSSFRSYSNYASVYTQSISETNSSQFYINNIIFDGSATTINAHIDHTADVLGHLLLSSNDNLLFNTLEYKPLEEQNPLIDFNYTEGENHLYYKIAAINVCHDTNTYTNTVQAIKLTAPTADETGAELNWNKSYTESTENYEISIQVDGSDFPSKTANTTSANIVYEDIDPQNIAEVFCFQIQATESNGYTSTSNEICVSRQAKIDAPTAFTPNGDGVNDLFGPFVNSSDPEKSYIKNAVVEKFMLIIYDKYGGEIFKTNDSKRFWTGTTSRTGFQYATEGGYLYYLEFTTAQGKSYKKSGTINVVYP